MKNESVYNPQFKEMKKNYFKKYLKEFIFSKKIM